MLKRVKRRYLALAIEGCESCRQDELMDAVWGSMMKLYGEHGVSQINLKLIRFNVEENSAVVRTNHNGVDMVRAALALITKIAGKPASVHVLRVSGTLKALREKLNG